MKALARKKKETAQPEQPVSNGFVEGASGPYIPALTPDDMDKYDVNTTAETVYKRNWLIRILAIIIGVLILLLGIGYACTSVINSAGRFTVSMTGNLYGIQLVDNEKFENPTLTLYGSAVENMDNITKHWLLNKNGELGDDPVYDSYADIDKVYGDHNGTNYLAYTFSVRNGGEAVPGGEDATVDYLASLEVVTAYKGADEAIRVMVFINGKPTTYAKPRVSDGKKETFEADKNFISDTMVMQYTRKNFKVDQSDRYTVVVWLEGEDPECVNDIMGGEVKLKMTLEVLDKEKAD